MNIKMENHTKELIDFIIKQESPGVKYYPELEPLIIQHFEINTSNKKDTVMECIKDIIDWENGKKHATLEETLKERYSIIIRSKPYIDYNSFNKVIRD